VKKGALSVELGPEMRALALLLLSLYLAHALSLVQLWHYKAGSTIEGLAFSDNGNLGAASWGGCAYVFDQSGNLLNKVCGGDDMDDASYCCGRFGFVNWDKYAYITDQNGNLIKKVHVGGDYVEAITMTEDGFVACRYSCALFDFNGNKKWDLEVGEVENGPSHYNGYWYVADIDWNKLLIVKDGSVVKEISYGESAYDTAVCGKYLAVSTLHHLYLYDLSDPANPRELWNVGGLSGCGGNGCLRVRFSPDCKYIAVADTNNHKLKIFDLKGNLVLEKDFGSSVYSVAWWRDRIAVGLRSGDIYVYKVEGLSEYESLSSYQKQMYSKCYSHLKTANYCLNMAKEHLEALSTVLNLPCSQMVPYALKLIYSYNIVCPPGNTTKIVNALAQRYCSQFNSLKLPALKGKVTTEDLLNMMAQCIKNSNKPISEVLPYCANQVAKKAAEMDKEYAQTYAQYLHNYARRMEIVAGVLAPWIKRCGKVPAIEVPDVNQLFTAELVKLAGGTVYTVTKTVTKVTTVSIVTFVQGTTIIPVNGSPSITLTTTVFTNPFVRTVTKTVTMHNRVTTVSLITKTVTETKTVSLKPSENLVEKVLGLKDKVQEALAAELVKRGIGPKCANAVADVVVSNFIDALKEKTGVKNAEYLLTLMACNTPECFAKALANMIQEEVLPISPQDLLELSPCVNDLGLQRWLQGIATVTVTKYLTVSTVTVRPVTRYVTVTRTVTTATPATFAGLVQLAPGLYEGGSGNYYFNTPWEVKGTVMIVRDFPRGVKVPPQLAVPKSWVAVVDGEMGKTLTLPDGSYLDVSVASLGNATLIVNGKAYKVPQRWTEVVVGPLRGSVSVVIKGKVLIDYFRVYKDGKLIVDEEFSLNG